MVIIRIRGSRGFDRGTKTGAYENFVRFLTDYQKILPLIPKTVGYLNFKLS